VARLSDGTRKIMRVTEIVGAGERVCVACDGVEGA